jgi:hypothetical protein
MQPFSTAEDTRARSSSWWLLGAAVSYFVINLALFARSGVLPANDTVRYTRGVELIMSGRPLEELMPSYLGYIYFLIGLRPFSASGGFVIVVQLLLSAVALWCLSTFVRAAYGRLAAVIFLVLVLVNPQMFLWQRYILTESLFVSLSMMSVPLLLWRGSSSAGALAASGLLAGLLFSIRPHGVAFVALYVAFVVIWSGRTPALKSALVVVPFVIFLGLLQVTGASLGGSYNFTRITEPYVDGQIIWGYDRFVVPFAPGLVRQGNLATIVACLLDSPVTFAKNFVYKVITEITQIRPYYSLAHNAISAGLTVLAAGSVIVSLAGRMDRNQLALLLLVALQLGFVGVTFADWDCRFILYSHPFIAMLGAIGLSKRWRNT